MKILALSSYLSPNLATKTMAAELRDELLKYNQPVVLDFSGVRLMSYSFSEEFFGKLFLELGTECLNSRFRVRNMNTKLQGVFNSTLASYSKVKKKAA